MPKLKPEERFTLVEGLIEVRKAVLRTAEYKEDEITSSLAVSRSVHNYVNLDTHPDR